jgi:hypothetical protein
MCDVFSIILYFIVDTVVSDIGRKCLLFYYLWSLKEANAVLFGVSFDKWSFRDITHISYIVEEYVLYENVISVVNRKRTPVA